MTCDCCGKYPDYEFTRGAKVCMDCWTDRYYQRMLRIEPGRAEEACTHGR